MNAERLSQIQEPKVEEYKPDDMDTKDIPGKEEKVVGLAQIETELATSVKKNELDLNGLLIDVNSILRKKDLSPEVLAGVKKYRDEILSFKEQITKTGFLPDKGAFQHLSRENNFRPAIKAAAAREFLLVGFDSLKSIDDIEANFFRASDYLPKGILDKDGNNMDETKIKRAFAIARETLQRNDLHRSVSDEVLNMIPEEYYLRAAVKDAVK